MLPVLVLGMPSIDFATAGFPPLLRWSVMALLLLISIGFVYRALKGVGTADNG